MFAGGERCSQRNRDGHLSTVVVSDTCDLAPHLGQEKACSRHMLKVRETGHAVAVTGTPFLLQRRASAESTSC